MKWIGTGRIVGLAAFACLLVVPASAPAAVVLERVGGIPDGNVNDLTGVTGDPGDRERVFVTDRTSGVIHTMKDGVTSEFLELKPHFSPPDDMSYEKGVYSMAFAPDYADSRLLYVAYATGGAGTNGGTTKLVEYRTDASGIVIDASRRDVLTIDHSTSNQHYGGQIQFGPDGYLYLSTGDAYLPTNAQSLSSRSGKILRINPRQEGAAPFTVPVDNPFVQGPPAIAKDIWSYGFRNPWRFSFDKLLGDLTVGDVGDVKQEEVDFAAKAAGLGGGLNFGWPCFEGTAVHTDPDYQDPQRCNANPPPVTTPPVFTYAHNDGSNGQPPRCALIGGYISRDPGTPELYGRYVYSDLCSEELRSVELSAFGASGDRLEMNLPEAAESFGEDSCGRLYVAIHRVKPSEGGAPPTVYRLTDGTPTDCSAVTFPAIPTPPPGLVPQETTRITLRRSGPPVVRKGKRTRLKAIAKPCPGRAGDRVLLKVGKKTVARKRLNGKCTATFSKPVRKRTAFRASIAGDTSYLAAMSRPVRVKLKPRR